MSAGAAPEDASPEDALSDFIRFPQWMWRNTAVRDFVAWLRAHNDVQRQRAFMVAGPGAAEPGHPVAPPGPA
jgi:erythromycin esterase-like protein